jgi:hypothetical protein
VEQLPYDNYRKKALVKYFTLVQSFLFLGALAVCAGGAAKSRVLVKGFLLPGAAYRLPAFLKSTTPQQAPVPCPNKTTAQGSSKRTKNTFHRLSQNIHLLYITIHKIKCLHTQ